jgi:hypothetical protein
MRSAIRHVVNAYVRSSLRMSVEQVLIHRRRGYPSTAIHHGGLGHQSYEPHLSVGLHPLDTDWLTSRTATAAGRNR